MLTATIGSDDLVAAEAGAANAIRGAAVMAAPAMTPAANFLISDHGSFSFNSRQDSVPELAVMPCLR